MRVMSSQSCIALEYRRFGTCEPEPVSRTRPYLLRRTPASVIIALRTRTLAGSPQPSRVRRCELGLRLGMDEYATAAHRDAGVGAAGDSDSTPGRTAVVKPAAGCTSSRIGLHTLPLPAEIRRQRTEVRERLAVKRRHAWTPSVPDGDVWKSPKPSDDVPVRVHLVEVDSVSANAFQITTCSTWSSET